MRVFLRWNGAELLEQGHVDVGLDVALDARVAVPVPGPAEVSGRFHDPEVADPGLLEAHAHQHAVEAAADDQDGGLLVDGVTGEAGRHVGIDVVVRAFAGQLLELSRAVLAQSLVALLAVLLANGVEVGKVVEAGIGGAHFDRFRRWEEGGWGSVRG